MRNAFAKEITRLAIEDDRIVLLSGDIGNRLFDEFKDRCPDRFYNCGVAEANMIGVAAGLAMSGFRPVCYTIAPFLTYRCIEQIRVDLCYHKLPVVLVGTGSGLAYASLGATHHSCEEVGMLRLLPQMVVLAPSDSEEVRASLGAALRQQNPAYNRIGKKGEPPVHLAPIEAYEIGRAIPLKSGQDVCVLASGATVSTALQAAAQLDANGVHPEIWSFLSVKPLDENVLRQVFSRNSLVITLEEHSRLGGLGGAVAEWLSDQPPLKARLIRMGTDDAFFHEIGSQKDARQRFGLTAEDLAKKVLESLPAAP